MSTEMSQILRFIQTFKYKLSCVATRVFSVRLLHAVAFSKQLRWFEPTNEISMTTQLRAVKAR